MGKREPLLDYEVAEMLGCTKQMVKRYALTGRLVPYERQEPGGFRGLLFLHETVAAFIEAQRPRAKPPKPRPSHLYLVEIVGHSVKVGISSSPVKRVAKHERDARRFGFSIGRVWVSYAHEEADLNEKLMQIGCRSRSEYLERRFERLVAKAHKLKMTRVEVSHG